MPTQPSATEPAAINNHDHDCEIVNGSEVDGGVQESKGDESPLSHRLCSRAKAAFVVPEGFKRVRGDKRKPSNMYKLVLWYGL